MEDKKENNKLVNRLTRLAFGRGFKGTCYMEKKYDSFDDDCFTTKHDEPHDIVKRWWFPIPFAWEILTYAGKFTNPDGSSLEVREKFLPSARRYANLYRKETGRNVDIALI